MRCFNDDLDLYPVMSYPAATIAGVGFEPTTERQAFKAHRLLYQLSYVPENGGQAEERNLHRRIRLKSLWELAEVGLEPTTAGS